jgi:predicted DNA-binding WGR domain protein
MIQLALFQPEPVPLAWRSFDAPGYLHFTSIDPQENRFRFYTITWQKTLWGEWTIRTTWGRIGGVGRSKVTYFESEQALREALPAILARRFDRGYVAKAVADTTIRQPLSPDPYRVHQLVTVRPSVYLDKCTA